MLHQTDDVRIERLKPLIPPAILMEDLPITEEISTLVAASREEISRILNGADDRLLVVVGPCSIHDPEAALEYARLLKAHADRLRDDLRVVMRVYFEKPRTIVGWKGLINDPHLDGTFAINEGLHRARGFLLDVSRVGLPAGTEFLDPITPQFIADIVSWGAIGARTSESQVHRELASGLSCPVGFKNGTDGNVRIAMDAIRAAQAPHHFLSVTKAGHSAIVSTAGNEDCHIILRGGNRPNYDAANVDAAAKSLAEAGAPARIMIDCSHGNSGKDPSKQVEVGQNVSAQIAAGDARIVGIMVESHLKAGRQDLIPGKTLTYGQSITDACIGWEDTRTLIDSLADALRQRRVKAAANGESE
jgi:3-deoxy-7-phosphoheptulonate synthase